MDHARIDREVRVLEAADALLAAAAAVYDNDDAFTENSPDEHRSLDVRQRDRALGEAIGAYKFVRGIK